MNDPVSEITSALITAPFAVRFNAHIPGKLTNWAGNLNSVPTRYFSRISEEVRHW